MFLLGVLIKNNYQFIGEWYEKEPPHHAPTAEQVAEGSRSCFIVGGIYLAWMAVQRAELARQQHHRCRACRSGLRAPRAMWPAAGAVMVVLGLAPPVALWLLASPASLACPWRAAAAFFATDALFVAGALAFLWIAQCYAESRAAQLGDGPPAPYPGAWVERDGRQVTPRGFAPGYLGLALLLSLLAPGAALCAALALGRGGGGGGGSAGLAAATLGPYLAVFLPQIALETRVLNRSVMTPVLPLLFWPHRLWQLLRGLALAARHADAHGGEGGWLVPALLGLLSFWVFDSACTLLWMPGMYDWQLQDGALLARIAAQRERAAAERGGSQLLVAGRAAGGGGGGGKGPAARAPATPSHAMTTRVRARTPGAAGASGGAAGASGGGARQRRGAGAGGRGAGGGGLDDYGFGAKETYVCLRCMKGYVPARGSDGRSIVQCVCPPGTFQNVTGNTRQCTPCPTGSYCPGGDKNARLPTDDAGALNSCNPAGTVGLTTKSASTTRAADCIAQAGYVLPTSRGGSAQQCAGNTYAPDLNRLKTCLPCQSGLAAPTGYNGTRDNKNDVCQVPPGKFWELNVVRDCPKGLYRSNFVRTDNKLAINCLSCPEGWTTASIASTGIDKCNVLMPGYKLATTTAGTEPTGSAVPVTSSSTFVPTAVEACPVGFFFDGTAGTWSCKPCPYNAITLKNGSTSADDCVVPPGYYVRGSAANGTMAKCPTTPANTDTEGYYRTGWKAFKEVVSASGDGKDACTPCGAGILSDATETDELPSAAAGSKVAATSASCYIKAGWGITFDPADFTKFKAIKPCPANTYGVANTTFGLINAPCKACTKNLYSAAASTSFDACLNPGGFGYTSEGANQCPDGFWAAAASMQPCEPCPEGRTTLYEPGNGTLQDSITDCIVPAGSGLYDGNSTDPWNPSGNTTNTGAKPCPVGYYSAGGASALCLPCGDANSTMGVGSTTCDSCASGFGKASGSSTCELCDFNSFNTGLSSDSCMSCPTTTFNDPVGDGYTSYGLTYKRGETRRDACVPRFAQVPKPVGDRMGLPAAMLNTTVSTAAAASVNAAVKLCVEACPPGVCCIAEMVQTGSSLSCKHARLTPVWAMASSPSTAMMMYKVPPSEFAAASTKVGAKTMGSGMFAACDITDYMADARAGLIGTSTNPALVEAGRGAIEWNTARCNSIDTCKAACLAEATCWGFIVVPGANGPDFALRGGESFLGGRSFFVSPDGKLADSTVDDTIESWTWFAS
ncbi:hypothetical protein HT031_000008 [Scenedesmus sp. PABB004]|nr:hypothetical protein HT031_000008 [Scenedesmus sp. PABB004]